MKNRGVYHRIGICSDSSSGRLSDVMEVVAEGMRRAGDCDASLAGQVFEHCGAQRCGFDVSMGHFDVLVHAGDLFARCPPNRRHGDPVEDDEWPDQMDDALSSAQK